MKLIGIDGELELYATKDMESGILYNTMLDKASSMKPLQVFFKWGRFESPPSVTAKTFDGTFTFKGGKGSGHRGHAGRPGLQGGSLPGSVAVSVRTGRAAAIRAGWKPKPKPEPKPKKPTSVVKGMPADSLHIEDANSRVVRKHIEDLNKFPPKLHEHVSEHIEGVYVGDKPVTRLDANEHMAGVTPRGWPMGSTWDDVAGGVTTGGVALGSGRHGSASLAGHEYAHAIGKALGLDRSQAMYEHHKRLYHKLSPYHKGKGIGSRSGKQETFAEAVAVMIARGDKSAARKYDKQFISWLREEVFNKWQ